MLDLSARQVHILRAIIEEFIRTAEPVGSETIDKKYSIGVSPATIRNEMVFLSKQGYLQKSHSSAGRIPTPQALRLYVNELVKEKDLTVADEVQAKEKMWNSRNQADELISEMIKVLADKSHALGLALVGDKKLYHAGYANLLHMPEFYDIQVMRHVLQLIEQAALIEQLFTRHTSDHAVQVIYGSELGNKHLQPIGLIHMTVMINGQPVHVGVLGSSRFDYSYILPMMKYFKELVQELSP